MKKYMNRHKIPPLSSNIYKSQNTSIIPQKNDDEKNKKDREYSKNSSIDYEDLRHNAKFRMLRKISRSGYIARKEGKTSNLITNINSKVNIYKDMNLMNAPSFKRNMSEIHKIIKIKKYKNIRKLDKMFFNSAFSNENLNDFNKLKKSNLLINNRQSNLISIPRNNSCEELFDVSKKFKNIIKNEETQQLSTNFSKLLDFKKNNSKNTKSSHYSKLTTAKVSHKTLKNNTSSYSSTTNKSMNTNKFPEQQSVSNICINDDSNIASNNISSLPNLPKIKIQKNTTKLFNSSNLETEKIQLDTKKKKKCFITSLNTDKMRFDINQLIIDNEKGKEKIDEFEERILKLKIFQTYQKERLQKLLNDDKFNIQDRIDYIIKMYKTYENIYFEYNCDFNAYFRFLFEISNDLDVNLKIMTRQKKDMLYSIEVLVDRIIKKQKELEYSINTRNFIFYVKNRDKKIIPLNNQYVYRVSKRKKLIETLFDILGRSADSLAFKYLKRIIPEEQLESMLMAKNNKSRKTTKRITTMRKSIRSMPQIKDELSPPPPGEKIFESSDEFVNMLNNLNSDNIKLLKDYENSQIDKSRLIKELNEAIATSEKNEKSLIQVYIKSNERNLELKKKKYLELTKRYEYIKNLFDKKDELSSLKVDLKITSFDAGNSIYNYNLIKYNKLRKEYKYEGLVILEKLIDIIKSIFSINKEINLFDINEAYQYIPYDKLKQLLRIKIDFFNDDNQNIIRESTLKLIKLYVFFAEILINKIEEEKKLDYNGYLIQKEKIQRDRKIYNTNLGKKMIEEKRDAEAKRLMEKWNKQIILDTRKIDIYKMPKLKKSLTMENLKEKPKKENDEYNEYNLLVEE